MLSVGGVCVLGVEWGVGWSGDSLKTLEVAHPVGLALGADSGAALALQDVRSLCVDVCVREQHRWDGDT